MAGTDEGLCSTHQTKACSLCSHPSMEATRKHVEKHPFPTQKGKDKDKNKD